MFVPNPRGPISTQVSELIKGSVLSESPIAPGPDRDVVEDEDVQIALFMIYELHYHGFDDAMPEAEWDPAIFSIRTRLERVFLLNVKDRVPTSALPSPAGLAEHLFAMVDEDGPSLSRYLARNATRRQFQEFAVHRSAYQSKEADPYTWAIPRLSPAAKSALVEIQIDEYGGGRVEMMHQELFRKTLRGLGLSDSYGYYVDHLPAVTLAATNVITLLGMRRSERATVCGHFAALEMTSSIPNRRYARGLRRLGFGGDVTHFFDEHVEADAVHEQLAVGGMCAAIVDDDPGELSNIVFGVSVYLWFERALSERMLDSWRIEKTSLRQPIAGSQRERTDDRSARPGRQGAAAIAQEQGRSVDLRIGRTAEIEALGQSRGGARFTR